VGDPTGESVPVELNDWERRLLALLLEDYISQVTAKGATSSARKALGEDFPMLASEQIADWLKALLMKLVTPR
jgi:hypothetical protein